MRPRLGLLRIILAAMVVLSAANAVADDVLEGTPVVRRNNLYRAGRQEIGVVFGASLGDPYERNFFPGARYDIHLADWIAIGADLLVGIGLRTGMAGEIETKVTKLNETFAMQTSRLALVAGGHAAVTPFSGKFMLFGSVPMHFDIHMNMGAGVANASGIVATSGGSQSSSISLTPWIGGGGRIFVSRVLAVTADLNDYFVKRTLAVDRNNQPPPAAYSGQLILTVGLSFFVPPDLKRAD